MQNLGHKKAKNYEVMISFSSNDKNKADPGVRIVAPPATDNLKLGYLYQHKTNWNLNGCNDLKDTVDSLLLQQQYLQSQQNKTDTSNSNAPPIVADLTRQTYEDFKLTRDVLILCGSLEANLFQATTMIIAVPNGTKKFAVVFNTQCTDCSWIYDTITYAQLVRVE